MATKSKWEKSEHKEKKIKIFLYGPPGTFKTRTGLRLGSNGSKDPALAVIDTEFGTDRYSGDFNFLYVQSIDADEIFESVRELVKNPKEVKTLMIDTFSVYHEALTNKFTDLYLKREIRSSGHKGEYYTLAPKDYQPINREASNFVRFLLKCDLNIIATAQVKDQWNEKMVVSGTTHDGWKRLPYYFDLVIELVEKKGKIKAIIHKDRTNHFEKGKEYSWESDKEAAELISKALGYKLSEGPSATAYKEEEVKTKTETSEPKAITKKQKPVTEKKPETPKPPVTTIQDIVKLKKELKIRDRKVWDNLLKPYKVKTAKDMTEEQLAKFAGELEDMRPS